MKPFFNPLPRLRPRNPPAPEPSIGAASPTKTASRRYSLTAAAQGPPPPLVGRQPSSSSAFSPSSWRSGLPRCSELLNVLHPSRRRPDPWYKAMGLICQRAIVLYLGAAVLLTLLYWFSGSILKAIGQSDSIAEQVQIFARGLIPQIYAFALSCPMQRFLQAQTIETTIFSR